MGLVEGILISSLPTFLIIIFMLNSRINALNKSLNSLVKETDHHFKEVDYAFLSVAQTLENIASSVGSITGMRNQSAEKIEKMNKNTERFLEISKITREQLDLYGDTQAPSASASHSKHKSSIIGKLKELEERKKDLMREMVADGLDPEITFLDEEGSSKTMKMSEALAHSDSTDDKGLTDQKTPRNKDGNVINLFKGDDDDDNNPGKSTLQ